MCVSDVITNVTKQDMNVMALTLNDFKTSETLERQKQKVLANQNNFDNQNVPYILTKKVHTNT